MARKKISIEISNAPRHMSPEDQWIQSRESISQRTQDSAPSFTDLPGNLGPCNGCTPETPSYTIGDSGAITDGTGAEVGQVVDSQPVLSGSLSTQYSIVSNATDIGGGDYELPVTASYVTDVWFDDLHATYMTHWDFAPDQTITVFSPIDAGTVVKAAYVTTNVQT